MATKLVMGGCKHIKKDIGDGNALDHYNSLRGQDKLACAMQLKVDRSAAFMTATEHQGVFFNSGRIGDITTGCT